MFYIEALLFLYRCRKVAGTMQALLGGDEIYHYHSKLMMKVTIVIVHHFNCKTRFGRLPTYTNKNIVDVSC